MSQALSPFGYFLITANILGFVLYGVNILLYRHTENGNVDPLLTIVALLGGSLGIVLFILLFDRKAGKENMMSRVFVSCLLIIQIIVFLYLSGHHGQGFHISFGKFFGEHKILILYLLGINVITLVAFGVDKINSIEHKNRIRIVTLLGLAFIGGSIGALIAMYAFRHKTKKDYFTVGIPLIMIMQLVVIIYFMNV